MEWKILEIPRTKDKNEITKAYRSKLLKTNPEDKPEEFKTLRDAYEKAMKYAEEESTEEGAENLTPVSLWLNQIKETYHDFRRRQDLDCWRELLADEVCLAIDTRPEAEDSLLTFLMDSYRLPKEVWTILDGFFAWEEREAELSEKYPPEFIRYCLIGGKHEEPVLPYELFDPGKDGEECDNYMHLYYELSRLAFDDESFDHNLEMLRELSEYHPYGQMLAYEKLVYGGNHETLAQMEELCGEYPEDATLSMRLCDAYCECKRYDKAKPIAERLLQEIPDHYRAKWRLAHCLKAEGLYNEAMDLLGELFSASGGDRMRIFELTKLRNECNEALINKYEEELTKEGDHNDTYENLAWNYFQNNHADKAYEYAILLREDDTDAFSYNNLFSGLYLEREEYEKALMHINKLIVVVENMQEDGSKKTAKRIRRRAEMYLRRAQINMLLKDYANARKDGEFAYQLEPDSPENLNALIRLYVSISNFEEAFELSKLFIQKNPSFYHGYLIHAEICHKLGYDREALDALEEAIALNPYDLGEYLLKAEIFTDHHIFDQAQAQLDYLCQNGLGDNVEVHYHQARFLDEQFSEEQSSQANESSPQSQDKLSSIISAYQKLEEEIEPEIHYGWVADYYYHYAVAISKEKGFEYNAEGVQKLFQLLDKGLKEDENNPNCLDYKGWILRKTGDLAGALTLYKKIEALGFDGPATWEALGAIYYSNLEEEAETALYYYKKLLDYSDTEEARFYCGSCLMYMRQYEEAEIHFQAELRINPEDFDAYNKLAELYLLLNRLPEALDMIDKSIDICKKENSPRAYQYDKKIMILRRMKRPKEAVETLLEKSRVFGEAADTEEAFEIYCQYGMWNEAKKLLRRWKFLGGGAAAMVAEAKYLLATGDYLKAIKHLDKCRKKLEAETYYDLWEKAMSFYKADCGRSKRLKKAIKEKTGRGEAVSGFDLSDLVIAYLWEDNLEGARAYVESAIAALKKEESLYNIRPAMFSSHRALLTAVSGDFSQAKAMIEECLTMPLCMHCVDHSCDDAKQFALYIELLEGNYKKVIAEAEKLQAEFPADTDYALIKHLAERKLKNSRR